MPGVMLGVSQHRGGALVDAILVFAVAGAVGVVLVYRQRPGKGSARRLIGRAVATSVSEARDLTRTT
jgi:hypothetical protein